MPIKTIIIATIFNLLFSIPAYSADYSAAKIEEIAGRLGSVEGFSPRRVHELKASLALTQGRIDFLNGEIEKMNRLQNSMEATTSPSTDRKVISADEFAARRGLQQGNLPTRSPDLRLMHDLDIYEDSLRRAEGVKMTILTRLSEAERQSPVEFNRAWHSSTPQGRRISPRVAGALGLGIVIIGGLAYYFDLDNSNDLPTEGEIVDDMPSIANSAD